MGFPPISGYPIGLAGAIALTRYAGGTTSGAPATGPFLTGDFIIAQNGAVWVCTAGGTPGTWVNTSQVGNGLGITSRTVIQQGTITYTPPAGTLAILVQCVAAGGGGGGVTSAAVSGAAGAGGGSAGYAEAYITAPGAGPFTVSVGAGGTAGTNAGGTGGTGGNSTFGAGPTVQANGGAGGTGMLAATTVGYAAGGPGASTTGQLGDYTLRGNSGSIGILNTGLIGASGNGGGAPGALGGGGAVGRTAAAAGNNGGQYGGGASGGLVLNGSGAVAGGVGANGLIVVWEFA